MQLFANSLADIASHFDRQSARANEAQVRATTAKAGAVHAAEARTWASAAALLRDTQMEPLQMVSTTLTINYLASEVNDLDLGPSRLSSVPQLIAEAIAQQGQGRPTSLVATFVTFPEGYRQMEKAPLPVGVEDTPEVRAKMQAILEGNAS